MSLLKLVYKFTATSNNIPSRLSIVFEEMILNFICPWRGSRPRELQITPQFPPHAFPCPLLPTGKRAQNRVLAPALSESSTSSEKRRVLHVAPGTAPSLPSGSQARTIPRPPGRLREHVDSIADGSQQPEVKPCGQRKRTETKK